MSHQPNNIFAGTQVVSLVEVRGTNNSLVHPRGAVGVVTRTPAVAGESISSSAFPMASRHRWTAAQIEVLKHFKDRLGDVARILPRRIAVSDDSMTAAGWSRALRPRILHHLPLRRRLARVWAGQRRIRHRPARHLPRARRTAMVALRRAGTIRGQRHAKLLLGIAEVPHHGAQGEPEHPGMPLLADGGKGHAAWARNCWPCARRSCRQMIFQTFNGYAMSQFKKIEQDIRNHGEVRWKHAMHLLRLLLTGAATLRERPRARARRGAPRPTARRQTRRTAVGRSGRLAQGTAPRLRTRPGRNQTARTPRLRSGESLSHQGRRQCEMAAAVYHQEHMQ